MRSFLPLIALGATTLLSVLSTVQGALQPGFCPDCQTFAKAMEPCEGTFTPADVEKNGNYDLQQPLAKCQCTKVMQEMLWTCARCEKQMGFQINAPPPNAHRSKCVVEWLISAADYDAPYTGTVIAGTQTQTGGNNPVAPPSTTGGNGGNGGTTGGGSSSTSGSNPSPSSDNSLAGGGNKSEGGGINGTAIGISVGIIGVAVVCGMVAVVMMKRRRRRRHQPLELNPPPLSGFTNLDDQWEKPSHTTSQATGNDRDLAPAASRMPMQGRPEPFETRPYTGGPESHQMPPIAYTGPHKGGYDGYDGGYDGYDNHGGYDPNYYDQYNQHGYPPQHPPHHEYYDAHAPQQYRNPRAPESVVSGGYV